jgi:hypothetical protein
MVVTGQSIHGYTRYDTGLGEGTGLAGGNRGRASVGLALPMALVQDRQEDSDRASNKSLNFSRLALESLDFGTSRD